MKGSEYAQYFAQEPKKVRNLDLNEAEIGSYAKNWPTQAPAQEQNTKHKTQNKLGPSRRRDPICSLRNCMSHN